MEVFFMEHLAKNHDCLSQTCSSTSIITALLIAQQDTGQTSSYFMRARAQARTHSQDDPLDMGGSPHRGIRCWPGTL
eukprot:754819-Hanusia_phi.AAC.6